MVSANKQTEQNKTNKTRTITKHQKRATHRQHKAQLQTQNKIAEPHLLDVLLTEREKEILLQTINGLDAKRIASMLDISVLTIRKHIANIYQKLHVNSKAQIISLAHKNNWV